MYKPAPIGEWQEAWLRSLESGVHKQTRSVLSRKVKNGWAHCCLGIVCQVAITNGVKIRVEVLSDVAKYRGHYESLPNSEIKRFGFLDETGKISTSFLHNLMSDKGITEDEFSALLKEFLKLSGGYQSLAAMNDNGKTFKQIARFVRRFPRAVFTETK
ncbi:MAG: hypothetical protein HC888_05380 [Candidatus Competibacteraceae bacterium]|nr:hypothetical protein [Candidatus Competibacteraceae bacterium]